MADDQANTSADDKESLARAQLPYRAEYCKTSRAKCKKCTENMEANSLKLANMTKSRWHDGYDATYYHVPCFFRIKRPNSVAEIRHFETLKYEDQKMLEKAVETQGKSVLGTTVEEKPKGKESKSKSKKAKKRGPDEDSVLVNYEDFLMEYAKSSRAKCKLCDEKIDKETVRLGKLDYEADTPWNGGPVPRWYHVDCFVKSMEKIDFYGLIEKVKGYDDLEKEDQKMLRKKVKPIVPKAEDERSKKPKMEAPTAEEETEEKLLKQQSDRFFKLREQVDKMKRKDIELLLDSMDQKSNFKASSMLIDMATDVLLFGPLGKCPECKKSKGMLLRGSSYICTGGTESNPCTFETREPKRGAPDIPNEILDKYDYFYESYEFQGGKRVFPSKFLKAVEQKEAEDNNLVLEGAPLEGLHIGVISWNSLQMDKLKVQKKITTLGGKVHTALDRSLFVILSSTDELTKETPKVEVAKALEVPFAIPDFLFDVKTKADVVPRLKKSLIGDWSGDIEARFNQMTAKEVKSEPADQK